MRKKLEREAESGQREAPAFQFLNLANAPAPHPHPPPRGCAVQWLGVCSGWDVCPAAAHIRLDTLLLSSCRTLGKEPNLTERCSFLIIQSMVKRYC